MFDLATLQASGNIVAPGQIVWSAAQLESLASLKPSDEGAVSFSIKIADAYLPPNVVSPTIRVSATLSTPTRPPGLTAETITATTEHTARVRGELQLSAQAVRDERTSPFRNSGPLPPRVGEDSTFTVHWELRSLATPFRDVTIAARLPSGVEWTDKTYLNGPYGAISYTAATREVLWRIPRLEANQGTGAVGLLAVFHIRLRPSHADAA